MKTQEEIIQLVNKEREIIWKSLYRRLFYVKKSLKELKKHQKNALIFLSIENPIRLCQLVKTNFFNLQNIINNPIYSQYKIPKKKGGYREILAPKVELKKVQKKLNYYLQAYYLWIKPGEVKGFIINPKYLKSKCDIIENARAHVGKKYILNIDLKDFFQNISAKRVKTLFSSTIFGYNEQIATALTLLTTYKGKLPTGAPTSPVISNFLCLQMDKDLKEFCESNSFQYSRYADDLTFSSNREIDSDQILDIINIIKRNNFEINKKKIRLRRSDQKQVVTGIVVNKKINVDRKLIRRVRAMIHDITLNGLEVAYKRHFGVSGKIDLKDQLYFRNKIEGYITFIGQVRGREDPIYTKLNRDFNKSFWIGLYPAKNM